MSQEHEQSLGDVLMEKERLATQEALQQLARLGRAAITYDHTNIAELAASIKQADSKTPEVL